MSFISSDFQPPSPPPPPPPPPFGAQYWRATRIQAHTATAATAGHVIFSNASYASHSWHKCQQLKPPRCHIDVPFNWSRLQVCRIIFARGLGTTHFIGAFDCPLSILDHSAGSQDGQNFFLFRVDLFFGGLHLARREVQLPVVGGTWTRIAVHNVHGNYVQCHVWHTWQLARHLACFFSSFQDERLLKKQDDLSLFSWIDQRR